MNTIKCCSQVGSGRWTQETYETSTGDARIRAKELRSLGYQVSVSSLGSQVTPLGTLRLTMVDIRPGTNPDTCDLPKVEKVEWPR